MTRSPSLRRLHFLNALFAPLTGHDLYLAQQIDAAPDQFKLADGDRSRRIAGQADLVEEIRHTQNHAYVSQLLGDERFALPLAQMGISPEEAAAIQPEYCPSTHADNVCGGYFTFPRVQAKTVIHARILDLAGGKQPMHNADRTKWIVFNGEIYNYRELRSDLAARGHRFATRSDTEVIVHAWEQWGEDCVKRLRGMFAFVLWDRNRQTLFMARDRLGVKPLYYALLDDGTLLPRTVAPTTGEQVPTDSATSHALHWPSQVELQQTPSAQKPDLHSV